MDNPALDQNIYRINQAFLVDDSNEIFHSYESVKNKILHDLPLGVHRITKVFEKKLETRNFCFFDCETTGFKNSHLVQLAYITTDGQGKTLNSVSQIIKPNGFTIPDNAIAIHGITNEIAHKEGKPLYDVLHQFLLDTADVDLFIAHNLEFDLNILTHNSKVCGLNNTFDFLTWNNFCTMRNTVDYCGLEGEQVKLKYPKLEELYQKVFGKELENTHNALVDATACKDCFLELLRQNQIKI